MTGGRVNWAAGPASVAPPHWPWHIRTDIVIHGAEAVRWLGNSLAAVRDFAPNARKDAGYGLYRVQRGEEPSDWKPMGQVGAGVREIRIHADGEHRVLYLATLPEAVFVLHAFVKKTHRTRTLDIELARARLKHLRRQRGQG